jgi:anti-sigma factor RsiW
MFRPPILYNKVAPMSDSLRNPDDLPESTHPAACANGPDFMDLAAFVDDRLSDSQRQEIESHLTICDACRAAVADARESREQENESRMIFVPPAVIEAATALVTGTRDERVGAEHHDILKHVRTSRWITFVRRGVAIAALIGICIAGHSVGTLISGGSRDEPDSLGIAMSFGLTDSSDQADDEGELFAISLSEASS